MLDINALLAEYGTICYNMKVMTARKAGLEDEISKANALTTVPPAPAPAPAPTPAPETPAPSA